MRDIILVPFLLFLDITQYIFFNPPYNLTSSLYFKAYKNGYKELAFIILFLLSILYIPSLSVVFILTPVRRPCSRYVFPSTVEGLLGIKIEVEFFLLSFALACLRALLILLLTFTNASLTFFSTSGFRF